MYSLEYIFSLKNIKYYKIPTLAGKSHVHEMNTYC